MTSFADYEIGPQKSFSGRHVLGPTPDNRRRSSLAAGFKCLLFDLGVVVKQKRVGEDESATTLKKLQDLTIKNIPTLARNNPVGPPFIIFVTE